MQDDSTSTLSSPGTLRPGAAVCGADGFHAIVTRVDGASVELRHPGGTLVVPVSLLQEETGGFVVDFDPRQQDDGGSLVLPVIAETLDVDREQVTTGTVRVRKHTTERETVVDEPVFREEVEVQRVPVDRMVAEPPAIRQEGDTTIVPVLEETLVVEKRLVLREELHIRRVRVESRAPQRVVLKTEHADVERIDDPAAGATASTPESSPTS